MESNGQSWTGGAGTSDWFTGANWSSSNVPGSNAAVILLATAGVVEINADAGKLASVSLVSGVLASGESGAATFSNDVRVGDTASG
jgi:hypothetical protein